MAGEISFKNSLMNIDVSILIKELTHYPLSAIMVIINFHLIKHSLDTHSELCETKENIGTKISNLFFIEKITSII
jgi:hypothetical protein